MTKLTGVFAPVVTPFQRDLSADAERLIGHCRWLVARGAGLAVFGTTSEGNSLSVDEKIELLDRLVDAGIDPSRLVPGTGSCALPDTVRLTEHAVTIGCPGVLMLPPFYYKAVGDDGLFRSFAEVIERVGDARLRMLLYHIPPVSHVPVTVGLIERLLHAYPDATAGIKDSSGDWENTKSYLDAFASSGFAVFPGSETFLLRAMRHGGAGCISATANVNPEAIVQLFRTWKGEDADVQQDGLDLVRGIFARYPLIPALKHAIAHFTRDDGWDVVRPPLSTLSAPERMALIGELDSAGFSLAFSWPANGPPLAAHRCSALEHDRRK
jgi:4-hydroxy-tetrahydrodipicolinate synthase